MAKRVSNKGLILSRNNVAKYRKIGSIIHVLYVLYFLYVLLFIFHKDITRLTYKTYKKVSNYILTPSKTNQMKSLNRLILDQDQGIS